MGSEVIAKCECGVEEPILIGCGCTKPQSTCYFPCLCKNCHQVVIGNLLSKRPKCPDCKSTRLIPYHDPCLIGVPGTKQVVGWKTFFEPIQEFELTDGKYLCPKCGNMTLEFSESGLLWD